MKRRLVPMVDNRTPEQVEADYRKKCQERADQLWVNRIKMREHRAKLRGRAA